MKTNAVYEIVDYRDPPTAGRIGIIRQVPGGLRVTGVNGSEILTWDDKDPEAFVDKEPMDQVTVITSRGRVEFVRLRLANWFDEIYPFWQSLTPTFVSDQELTDYFLPRFVAEG